MKTRIIVAALALVALAGGCARSPESQARSCQYYDAIYKSYLIAREQGTPSKAEIAAAQVAAVWLQLHCSYAEPAALRGGANEDTNAVPIIAAR